MHLKTEAAVSWQGLNFDFTGAVFDCGDFSNAQFSGGEVNFTGANFSRGEVDFSNAKFSGGEVNFSGTRFSGAEVDFETALFSGATVYLSWTGTPLPGMKIPRREDEPGT
jgi:uncharacterized protein YjbI with pentapeptide repeats